MEVIHRKYADLNFEKLLKLRLKSTQIPDDLIEFYLQHELRAPERGQERFAKITYTLRSLKRSFHQKYYCLDLGCGMGSALFPMSGAFKKAVGVDISFVDLLLAKKRFQEEGIKNVTLICASVEHLPFKNNTFDLINATDVIEHIRDQEKFLVEAYRVLQKGGHFYFNSPNRFNIFGPEPHVRLWGVGFLPRRWMGKYVKFLKGVNYKGKRLLSYFELLIMLNKVYNKNYRVFGIILDKLKYSESTKYKILKKVPAFLKIINNAMKPLIPGYQVLVFKDDE